MIIRSNQIGFPRKNSTKNQAVITENQWKVIGIHVFCNDEIIFLSSI